MIKIKAQSKNGYTLVELLAFTSIIVIVSGLIVGILYSTLRGGNKIKATNDVSQNGNYALSLFSNAALIARDVTKVGGVDVSDCTTKRQGTSIEFEQEDGSLVLFACDAATQSIASSSGTVTGYLIDNTSTKVDPATCNFTCFQATGNPYSAPIISIAFTISQKSSSTLFENVASGQYKTSVTMRNYSPR